MQKIWLIFIILLTSCSPQLVKKVNYDHSQFILWSESRNLTWDDFGGTPLDSSLASEIHVSNPSNLEKNNLFQPARAEIKTLFDRKNSWVNKEYASDLLLEYNQTIFDIYELYTRKMIKEFLKTKTGPSNPTDTFFKINTRINNELTNMVMNFRKESKMGTVQEVVDHWNKNIRGQISELDDYK